MKKDEILFKINYLNFLVAIILIYEEFANKKLK
jgi:hypothetical protein